MISPKVQQLLNVTNMLNRFEETVRVQLAQVIILAENEEEAKLLSDTVNATKQKMFERFAAKVGEFYTEDEIDELIKFYQSKVGQKSLSLMPRLAQEALMVSLEWINELETSLLPDFLKSKGGLD